jgi:hypothetical protein
MATQYSNKPIVTDGLVYALDFGNQKSYVSGSSSARSLKFGSVTGSILTFGGASIPNLQNGLLKMVAPTSTTGSTVDTLQQFSDLIPTGDFTIQIVISGSSNAFITQGPSGTRVISTLSSTTGMFGWYINPVPYAQAGGSGGNYYSRTAAVNSRLQHLTYRYSSGSYDLFVNGVPSPITARYESTTTNTGNLTINGRGTAAALSTQDLGNLYIYSRALTSDEIYSNYLIQAQRYGLPTIPKPYTIDENAYLFLSQSGITDPIITGSIDTFVRGLKSASLWDKMIAIYPFVGTGSAGVNLTGSQSWNLKEPTSAFYRLSYTGSWNGSTSGSTPSGSNTSINTEVLPFEYYPFKSDSNQHFSILSYDTPVSNSYLMGTGMTEDLAISTLAGDYGTPAAAYSVRKVRTAYSGALMDVRRSYDNVTSSIGYVSNGDLDTGSLLDWVIAGRAVLPGTYSGLAAAYSLRRVSSSYTGSAIDVRRDSDNITSSIGFDASGNLDTGALLAFVTGSANTGSGFVAQWYDQSGNNRHATQTATGSQPLIVSSGSLVTENGKPALRFDGVDDGFTTSDFISQPLTKLQITSVINSSNETGIRPIYTHYESTGDNRAFTYGIRDNNFWTNLSQDGTINNFRRYDSTGATTSDYLLYTLEIDTSQAVDDDKAKFYKNSILLSDTSTAPLGTLTEIYNSTSNFNIGYDGSSNYFTGSIQEIAFFSSSQASNRPLIENNINNYYNIYTGSNHGFVTRWYDQSGNNRHATQTATGSQPMIVESGSMVAENNKPGLYFDGIDDYLESSNVISGTTARSIFSIHNSHKTSSSTIYTATKTQIANGTRYVFGIIGTNEIGVLIRGGSSIGSYTPNTQHLVSHYLNSNTNINTLDLFTDGASVSLTDIDQNINTHNNNALIGVGEGLIDYFRGTQQELNIYLSNQSSNRGPIEYNINNYYNIYPQTSSFTTSSFAIYATSGSVSASLNNRLTSGIASSGPLGLITVSRTGSNSLTIARNGVTSSFAVPASGALSTGIFLGAINNNGLALGNSPLGISFASVGTGLTGNDLYNLNRLTYNLQSNLGRPDPNAVSFLTAANITDVTQSLAINTLVSDLKSYGVWDKMKAIYPFVGQPGVSSSFEFNLKNPNTFRGTFSGGWTFGSGGAKPNGITGYMDTGILPTTELSISSAHLSQYVNTNINLQVLMGNNNLSCFLQPQTTLVYGGLASTDFITGNTTNNQSGFYLVNRPASNALKIIKNNSILNTATTTGTSYSSGQNIFIGSYSPSSNFSNAQIAFASIGDGLTDTEAANLYTAVQRFQTTLGRQV